MCNICDWLDGLRHTLYPRPAAQLADRQARVLSASPRRTTACGSAARGGRRAAALHASGSEPEAARGQP
eukprot:355016-Chlamydomonas_euryale.AAC.3